MAFWTKKQLDRAKEERDTNNFYRYSIPPSKSLIRLRMLAKDIFNAEQLGDTELELMYWRMVAIQAVKVLDSADRIDKNEQLKCPECQSTYISHKPEEYFLCDSCDHSWINKSKNDRKQ